MQLPRRKTHRHRLAGFTLVELLAVIGIILVLSFTALACMFNALTSAQNATRVRNAQIINSAMTAYIAAGGSIQGAPPTVHSIISQLESSGVVDRATGLAGPFLLTAPDSTGLSVSGMGTIAP